MNKTSTIVIVILSVMVVFLGGLVIYNGYNSSNKTSDVVSDNTVKANNDNKVVENTVSTNVSVVDTISRFVGVYKYEKTFEQTDVSEESGCRFITETVNLELKSDGTFTYGQGPTCSGGISGEGTYAIGYNKIYLHNEKCNPVNTNDECVYPNCKPLIELQYSESNGEIIIKPASDIEKGSIELQKIS